MALFENLRYRAALRSDYDAEWGGEVATWIWSKLARGKVRQAAQALYECERSNRIQLGEELKAAGALLAVRNPLILGPGVVGGLVAALTPSRIHRAIYTSSRASKGVRRFYGKKARRFAPRADDLYETLTERHLDAFSAFKMRDL